MRRANRSLNEVGIAGSADGDDVDAFAFSMVASMIGGECKRGAENSVTGSRTLHAVFYAALHGAWVATPEARANVTRTTGGQIRYA